MLTESVGLCAELQPFCEGAAHLQGTEARSQVGYLCLKAGIASLSLCNFLVQL